ncbi:unnamed protein product [Ixodes pacificus]
MASPIRSHAAVEPREVPVAKSLLNKTSRQALAPNSSQLAPAGCNVLGSRESGSAESHADLCLKVERNVNKAESFKAESCFAPGVRPSQLGLSTSWNALCREPSVTASGEDCSGAPNDDLVPEDDSPIQSFRCSKQSPPVSLDENFLLVPDINVGANDSDDDIEGMFPEPTEEPQSAVLGDLCLGDGELGMLRDVFGRSWKASAPSATPPRSPSPLLATLPESFLDFESSDLPAFISEALQYVPLE